MFHREDQATYVTALILTPGGTRDYGGKTGEGPRVRVSAWAGHGGLEPRDKNEARRLTAVFWEAGDFAPAPAAGFVGVGISRGRPVRRYYTERDKK